MHNNQTKFVSMLIFNLFVFVGRENRIRDHPYHSTSQLYNPSQPYYIYWIKKLRWLIDFERTVNLFQKLEQQNKN